MIKAVSFDCAQTLLEVRWNPMEVAMQATELAGIDLPEHADSSYALHFKGRQEEWKRACRRHHPTSTSVAFWRSLTSDWLKLYGHEAKADDVIAAAEEVLFGPESGVFIPIAGAKEAVQELKQMGLEVIVLSNWDDSLVKVLTHCGLADLFDEIYASLVEGCEKPNPDFFSLAHESLGLCKEEVLHIGDNPLDDAVGAISFGWEALLFKNELAAGPWELNHESRELITKLRPEFSLDPWPPCPVIDRLEAVVGYVRELNS